MSETKTRHFQDWWRQKFGFVPHGDRVVCTLCHKSIVTRTSSVRRHFNTKHGPLIPPSCRHEYIKKCVAAFENFEPRPNFETGNEPPTNLGGFGRPKKPRKPELKDDDSSSTKIWLKWNSFQANIRNIFPSLLVNEQFVDVTLACDGRSLKCHKVILSACSPYFEQLLRDNPCQHPIVFMRDLKFWEIETLVNFMYCGEVSVAEQKLPSLLKAADALQIKGLASVPEDMNDSADSDDGGSLDRPNPKKPGRRKRKLAEPVENMNEPLKVEPPIEKKMLQDTEPPSESSKSIPEQGKEENLEYSNHPPLEVSWDSQEAMESRPQFEDDSSQETDSEQEKYIFNMDRTRVTDDPINPHIQRHNRFKQPINRIPEYSDHD